MVDNSKLVYLKDYDYYLPVESLRGYVLADIRKNMAWYKGLLKNLLEDERSAKNKWEPDQPMLDRVFDLRELYSKRLKQLEWKLQFLSGKGDGKAKFYTDRIVAARGVPVTNFIKVNRANFACCPIHQEKTPSFKYYPKTNTWWCYGACGTGGDTIDLVQMLYQLDFTEAINKLIGQPPSWPTA